MYICKGMTISVHATFGWHRVNFLHSSSYGVILWICGQKKVLVTQ